MAKRDSAPEQRPGFFSQLRTLYRFTREVYPWLMWAMIGSLIVGTALGVGAAFLFRATAWYSILLWGISGLMLGFSGAIFIMTRMANKVMYQRIDGQPGAAGHVLSTGLGRRWQASEMPVGVNPKTREAVYRAVGRGGIVIVGEGSRGRLKRLVNDERLRAQRVAYSVPITVLYVGHGEDEIPIDRLAKTIKKLPKTINKATRLTVIKRLDSVSQSLASLPIPKGIDPMKARASRPR